MTDTKKTSEEMEGDTEKAVGRSEFNALATMVSKGFESMTAIMSKALNVEAHDQNSPDKDKPEEIGDKTAKAEGDAMDQNNPDKAKPKEVGDKAKSTDANGTDENGTREKSGDDMTETEKTSDKEETEKGTKKDTTDDYDLQTVERATKSIEDLHARLNKTTEEDTKEKTSDKEETEKAEDEDETTKGMHPLDAFVATVSKTMEAMAQKLEKSGTTIPGFEKSIIDNIRGDAKLQEELASLIKLPGFKKSVSMGTPYVRGKDGRSYALTMTEAGATTIEKSQQGDGKAKSFKDTYKQDFSAFREDAQQ